MGLGKIATFVNEPYRTFQEEVAGALNSALYLLVEPGTADNSVKLSYPGAYYCSEPWKIDDEVPCGEDLLDGVPMAKLWTLHATVCERQGLEPNGVQTYAERDWFAARKAARAAASARDEGAQGAPGAAHGKEVPKDAQGNEKGVAGEDAQRDAQAAKEVTGGEVGDAGDDQSKQHVHNDNLPA